MSRRREEKKVVKPLIRNVVGVEDMVLLPDIKDTGIAANLRQRLVAEQIYTSIGHVLVACNPYKWLNIYDEDHMKKYTMQQRVDVTPHIFATAEAAYRNMIQEEDNQCVIISGESGAGSCKFDLDLAFFDIHASFFAK
jgi:myosin heavy subunit